MLYNIFVPQRNLRSECVKHEDWAVSKPHDGSSTQAGLGSRINNAILRSLPAAKYTHRARHVAGRLSQDGAWAGGRVGALKGREATPRTAVGLLVLIGPGMLTQGQDP